MLGSRFVTEPCPTAHRPARAIRAVLARAGAGALCVAAPAPVAAQAAPVDWAGLYLGLNLGAGFPLHGGERLQALGARADLFPHSATRPGVTFGAQAGYNWSQGPWLWGVETEFGLLDGRRSPSGVFAGGSPPAPFFTVSPGASADFLASIRARFGFAFDYALIYVTGGVAAGGARGPATLMSVVNAPPILTSPWSQSSRMKYALGAGVDYALGGPWSARAEYLFLNQSLNTQFFANGAGAYASRIRNETHLLRFGLNYHFGVENRLPGGPSRGSADPDHTGRPEGEAELYSIHAQTTHVAQAYPRFPARYDGPNSFPSGGKANYGSTTNLFMGLRLWEGGAVYVNPEIDQGYGLANSVGAAAYVNGAVAKVGRAAPYMRFQRYFLRQIIGLDDDAKIDDPDEGSHNEALESTQNQLSGKVNRDRLIITLGKFAVGDVFDDNIYAHDPSTGFLNFAFNTLGPFDYAADSWGYTHGLAVEWRQNWWTARGGVFQLSKIPNGLDIEPQLFRQYMSVGEFEARYEIFSQPGAIKFLWYGDNGYLANVGDAVNYSFLTGDLPSRVETARRRALKMGGGINVKQQIMPHLGFFLRAGVADGRYETVDYTDVDRQISAGLVAGGALWGRQYDEIGVAGALGGLHGLRARYFALGGTSVYIGDGRLSYGGEKTFEAYYKLGYSQDIDATLDYQLLVNPAHNLDRGPVNVFALRLRAAF